LDSEGICNGVVECTALVLAESCTEIDGRLTLFGVLDELKPGYDGETSFVVYAKFEGCEHATDVERRARILVTDEEGEALMESDEYPIWLEGTEEPVTIVTGFDLPEELGDEERILWVEAVLDDETLAQTAVRLRERYNV
jgi:hypothetical protein